MTEFNDSSTPVNPVVSISRLENLAAELVKNEPSKVNFGGGDRSAVEQKYNALLNRMKGESSEAYVLTWTGNKIPYGAEIQEKKVALTQNGIVTAEDGSTIGTYDRITEY
ncbi:MAG: hypothetical protein A2784_01225 [Candidatus Chisholmbacteria bacterium RIFCSPHIGHO2_01_FULL_48_12]|uniref:Uncharacterized protein n=1 Tax=Candidatus Chisholmbacteria bacterium RIFCSPHIGHO2_01_FULL_48_12 TaxID=1797589 RepID=A0A1G1VQP6_9BACT|nr:MAG: hypothetical protein A2784_01225 [Candidatus Chisholmbacteria bacterium RIFCSPHIGHO2_01_FULL_48_12]